MEKINIKPIGIISSPHKDSIAAPIQPCFATGAKGKIKSFKQYSDGLKDIEGFSHIIIIYHLHLENDTKLIVKPFLDDVKHGIFSTRHPARPNHIGLSVVKLISVENSIIHIEDIDLVDGTPLIDIKPYIPKFDSYPTVTSGWFAK